MEMAKRTRGGRHYKDTEMFTDYDIKEEDVPRSPPNRDDRSTTADVDMYRYYLKRMMCSVPRAEDVRGRTTDGGIVRLRK